MERISQLRDNQGRNHPRKGSRITVDPIRKLDDIKAIKKLLEVSPRDYLLFVLGINNGLRAGDLLRLRVMSFRNARVGDIVPIKERKTGKPQEIVINKAVKEALDRYFKKFPDLDDDDYLFKSRKGANKHLTVSSLNAIVKDWCKAIKLKGNFGSHSLRKTFGYILRREYGISWEIICQRLNHSSPSVTRRYLGIQDDEVNGVLMRCSI